MQSPSYCYKFYWLEAIVKLISENKEEAPKTTTCSYENYKTVELPFDFPVIIKPSNSVAYWVSPCSAAYCLSIMRWVWILPLYREVLKLHFAAPPGH